MNHRLVMNKFLLAALLLLSSCTPKTIRLDHNSKQIYEVEKAVVVGDTVKFIIMESNCRCDGCEIRNDLLLSNVTKGEK